MLKSVNFIKTIQVTGVHFETDLGGFRSGVLLAYAQATLLGFGVCFALYCSGKINEWAEAPPYPDILSHVAVHESNLTTFVGCQVARSSSRWAN
jgi:hypothetical protein